MLLSPHKNSGQNHDIKIANRCFGNVLWFKYLRTLITNQNLIQEEIKRRQNSGNACYHSVQNQTSGVCLGLFADDCSIYVTERKEGYVLRKLQRGISAMETWCERWNTKNNGYKD
jgi:hypothetical protein